MNTIEMYNKLKPYLATTSCYNMYARTHRTPRQIEFAPEENRPVKCWLPVKWMPPQAVLRREWTRLTYAQFCMAYNLKFDAPELTDESIPF